MQDKETKYIDADDRFSPDLTTIIHSKPPLPVRLSHLIFLLILILLLSLACVVSYPDTLTVSGKLSETYTSGTKNYSAEVIINDGSFHPAVGQKAVINFLPNQHQQKKMLSGKIDSLYSSGNQLTARIIFSDHQAESVLPLSNERREIPVSGFIENERRTIAERMIKRITDYFK